MTADPLGSLVKIRTSAANYSYSAEYWPYGEIQAQTGSNPTRWAFVGLLGYMRDLATMFYVRARYYRPAQTRWMTVDPLWPREHAYRYTRSPIFLVDVSGLGSCLETSLCPGTCCHDYWRSLGPDAGPPPANGSGHLLCCNGRKCACIWSAQGTPTVVKECQCLHEEVHFNQTASCLCSPLLPPSFLDPTKEGNGRGECAAYKVSIECLAKCWDNVAGVPVNDRLKCYIELKEHCRNGRASCKAGGGEFGSPWSDICSKYNA